MITERSLYNIALFIEGDTKIVLESSDTYKPISKRMKSSELIELIKKGKIKNCRVETIEARMDKSTPVIAITVYTDDYYPTSYERTRAMMDRG